jgi:hypothetical protein
MRPALAINLFLTATCVVLAPAADGRKARGGLSGPIPVEVDGKPLVREGGAAFPFVGDLDGDGLPDLLLGATGDGRLLVYRNVGTRVNPRLAAPQWFDDQVPTGRIPRG